LRVLRKPLLLEPQKAEVVVLTIVYLHNFLRRNRASCNIYNPPGSFDIEKDGQLVEGSWRQNVQPLVNVPCRSKTSAQEIRNEFATYFIGNGALPW